MDRKTSFTENNKNGSVLERLQTFMQTVDRMNETVLIPTKLMDLTISEQDKTGFEQFPADWSTTDMYELYNGLSTLRLDMQRGGGGEPSARRERDSPSPVSFESQTDGDSAIDLASVSDKATDGNFDEVIKSLHFHVARLNECLAKLSRAADGISLAYQRELHDRNPSGILRTHSNASDRSLYCWPLS